MFDRETAGPILGVAIKHGDLVIALPKPNRHNDVIRHMVMDLGITAPVGNQKENGQGFYVADGTYLNRKQAYAYARYIEQCGEDTYHKNQLFSEDLW